MFIVIPFEGRVRTLIRSSFVLAKRLSETTYNLSGDAFQMTQVTAEQALVFPDEVSLEEGTVLTDELLMQALPLENFISVSADEALPNVLGLLLRTAVADGRISDEELLSVQPALEGRNWHANIAVQVGDVFTYKGSLWRCIQAHTTHGGWQPDKTPALWHKVEVVAEGTVRVWAAGIDYVAGDEVAYPDAEDELYVCQQAHTSQAGWEPPGVPALWSPASESRQENSPVEEVGVYAKSKGCSWGTMDSMPEVPGIALRSDGHVGVYIGGGYAVEERSFSYEHTDQCRSARQNNEIPNHRTSLLIYPNLSGLNFQYKIICFQVLYLVHSHL